MTHSAREYDAFGGLTTQVGIARLTIERRTKFISSSDPKGPVTDSEVDHDAETLDNYHFKNPDHGQGVFASSWRWQWAGLDKGSCSLSSVLISPLGS